MPILTPELAKRAVDSVMPSIDNAIKTKLVHRAHCHIVILDPSYPRRNGYQYLYERSLGDTIHWEHPYDELARDKAGLVWTLRKPSHYVQQFEPYLLSDDSIKHGGGVILHEIVVAISGFRWFYDEMFAYQIAAACRALSIEKMEPIINNKDVDYIGEATQKQRMSI